MNFPQSVQSVPSGPSYVAGFSYTINELIVEMGIVPFQFGDKSFETVRFKDIYDIALVRFSLTFRGKTVNIFIPFYQSSGSNSSVVGAGTWFPFHCASQKIESSSREYYFRSSYGNTYLFKMGHYFMEPFGVRCEELKPNLGLRDLAPVAQNSYCARQRNFLIQQTAELPIELLHPEVDKGIGVHTVLQRFGNLLYLTASYFLFGNTPGWNPANFPDGTQERAFATVLTRISSNAKIGDKKWSQIVSEFPRNNFNPSSFYAANNSNALNYILTINSVPMPHYQDVLRMDNSADARFITYMKLLQMVGELYLEAGSNPLWDRFILTFNRAESINKITLIAQDNLNIGNEFHVWLLPEIFSGNNNLVRLYRFA